jgi:hypothetical protein
MKRIIVMASLAVAFALAGSAMLPAQEKTLRSPIAVAQEELGRGHYLAAIDALKRAAYAPDGTVRDPVALQVWQQFLPFMTNELAPAAPNREESDEMLGRGWASKIAAAMPRDAIAEIVGRARTTSIVILNEAHGSPRDRAFGLEVARALRPLGYSVLAVEAIRTYPIASIPLSGVEQLKADGFARMGTGIYTRDPVFAGFLRQALALGYEPTAYDATTAQMASGGGGVAGREQAQADNLIAAIFAKQPTAKVFLYVGASHVAEAPLDGTEWMAARLKRMTGVNPPTIDQATLTDLSARSAYDIAAARFGDRPRDILRRAQAAGAWSLCQSRRSAGRPPTPLIPLRPPGMVGGAGRPTGADPERPRSCNRSAPDSGLRGDGARRRGTVGSGFGGRRQSRADADGSVRTASLRRAALEKGAGSLRRPFRYALLIPAEPKPGKVSQIRRWPGSDRCRPGRRDPGGDCRCRSGRAARRDWRAAPRASCAAGERHAGRADARRALVAR